MIDINSLDFDKGNGLLPAIIQDADSHRVLMLGYMNKEALRATLEKQQVTFYSRSKARLWTKGETSGNYLELVDLQQDCDDDALLILAHPHGPTCHTGEKSCFYRKVFKQEGDLSFLAELESLIRARKKERPENSYTSQLFNEGRDKIAQKVGEEAVEAIIEAKNDNEDLFVNETSDLLYHLLVLLADKEISLKQIIENLEGRHKE